MGKITIEQTKNKYVVVNKLTYPEAINEREMNAIAGGLFECLIPVNSELIKKGVVLKSAVTGMISLQSYFSSLVSKKMFLDVIVQMIAVVKECEKNLMNVNNLVLDFDYIFLDPTTKKIKCIFWPIVNNQNAFIISEFFHELPFHVVFTKHENHDYVGKYLSYFKSLTPFSINGFEKLIFEILGITLENKTHLPSDSANIGESVRFPAKSVTANGSEGAIAYNPFDQNKAAEKNQDVPKETCANCGKRRVLEAKFCIHCGTSVADVGTTEKEGFEAVKEVEKSDTQNFSETVVLGTEEFDGGTTVLGADVYEEQIYPYLIREKTQEKISVNRSFFKIGKDLSSNDYIVSDNNAVSRNHAEIMTKETRFYIFDKNSTNKTYVDGRAIPPQEEIELFSGTKIKLGNEEFVFYL
jgi:hypothetical protein